MCGASNGKYARFCERCGTKIRDSSMLAKGPKVTEEKKGSNVKYLILVCVVLVAVLAVAAAYIFYGHPAASNASQAPNNTISLSTGFPLSETPDLAAEIFKANGNIATVQYHGVTLDKNQCLYILSKAIVMLNSGETGDISINQFGNASDPEGILSSAYITRSEYVDMASRTYRWMDSNGRSPNHTGIDLSGSPDLSPDMTLKVFANVLAQYKATGQLPASISV